MHRVIQPDAERSRLNSSDQYVSLIKEYEKMHGSGEGIFNGRSLLKFVDIIDGYLQNNDCKSVLDYGCGKGHLYTDKFTTITEEIDKPLPEYWGLEKYQLFDPAYEEHSKLPIHKKDAVICTDVLEHIPESDLGWVVDEIFSYATKMIFINVACFKALKHFEDGTNVHISVFTPEYWIDFLTKKSRNFRNLVIYLFADVLIKRHEDSDKITFVTKGFKIDHYPRIQELGEQE